jgi:uroporphyrin-3 C-methyltransferase
LKLEKRSAGAPETEAAQQAESSTGGKKPVIMYIMILFIVAFLLMALSFFMHQRSNTAALGELQHSVSAMQEVQANQEKIIELQDQLATAQATVEALEDDAEQAQKDLLAAQGETQALLALYTLQQQYSAADYPACQKTIQEIEAAGYETLLSKTAENGVTAPAARYQQLKEAVEAQLAA